MGYWGMIVPDPTNPFFMELISSFESIVSDENRDLLIASTHFDPQRTEACIQRMLLRRVNGIVFAASEMLATHESLRQYRIPMVTIDRGEVSERISDVSVDFDLAMVEAVRYLKQMGHNRIAFIGGFPGPKVSKTRVQAFRMAMQLAALDLPEKYVQGRRLSRRGWCSGHVQTSHPQDTTYRSRCGQRSHCTRCLAASTGARDLRTSADVPHRFRRHRYIRTRLSETHDPSASPKATWRRCFMTLSTMSKMSA